MNRLRHPLALFLLAAWATTACHGFSSDAFFVARPRVPSNSDVIARPRRARPSFDALPRHLTARRSSPTETADVEEATSSEPTAPSTRGAPDLHPPTLQAIASGLELRAQNKPDFRLRFVDDGSMEPWEVTFACGKVAQSFAETWMAQEGLQPRENEKDEELVQVLAGRAMGVLTRLEELEEELLQRCSGKVDGEGRGVDGFFGVGVPEAELRAWRTSDEAEQRVAAAAAAVDAACLFDPALRLNRARSLLGIFLEEFEGPGLRRNGVRVPCMDVDFLSGEEREVLFGSKSGVEGDAGDGARAETVVAADASAEESAELGADEGAAREEEPARPSLHPVTIDAIEEGLRLRAENSTTSPLRLLDSKMEWFEVQYSIVKFADRFLEEHSKKASSDGGDDGAWTEEELQTIGGRIVGVLARLDDLEWEWNHRVRASSLAEDVPRDAWRTTLGLHAPNPEEVEQACARTVDEALAVDTAFAKARAERMLALFLTNIEGPGLAASGNEVPGGSVPDFIEDKAQLELMKPRPRK